jgi:tyrosinase
MIYQNARDVISEFPGGEFKARMSDALHSFRLPYWDAAAIPPIGEGSYPWCVQRETIEVELPSGDSTCRVMILNPLYSYTFHPLPVEAFRSVPSTGDGSVAVFDKWIEWNRTVRFPTTKDAKAESQDRRVAFHLDWNSENIRQRTYSMLAMQKDFYNISNNLVRNSRGEVADSLESVHDTLHNTVGDGGHMWQTQYSSFDPIFWLLHA